MSTIDNSDSVYDFKQGNASTQASTSSNKKLFISLGIVGGIAIVTAIVLMAVLIPRGRDNSKVAKRAYNPITETEEPQSIKILAGNENSRRIRNLQGNDKIQILGDNFNELDSSNAVIYIDGKNVSFDKYVSVDSNTPVNIEIQFFKNLTTFNGMFKGCIDIKNVTFKNVKTNIISDTSSMFEGCTSLSDIKFEDTNISDITNTSKMFKDCLSLNTIEIEDFSTDKVKDMSQMFDGCSNFNNTTFIEELSTDNVENMNEMFSGCSNIKSLDLSGYDTSNVKDMSGMFKGMSSLEDLEIFSFDTEKVEYMNEMFESCSSIEFLDLSNFNTEKVIDMNRMFSDCSELGYLDISSFNITNCKNMTDMISNTTEFLELVTEDKEIKNRLGIKESQTIIIETGGTNESSEEGRILQELDDKIQIFGDNFNELNSDNAIILMDGKKVPFDKYLSIKSTETVKIVIKFKKTISTFKEMFSGCKRIKEVSLKNIETEIVLETTSMFEECTSLSSVKFENMNIYNITSTAKMFQKCTSLNKIEIEDFSTDKTKDMSQMFDGCSSLDNSSFIEGLSTKSAENMDEMFSGCSNIKSLNLSGYDTSNVKDMSGMFKGMTSLEEIEISSFNTEKVEYMSEMFESCTSIINLDLSNFNTEMVINMDRMFSSCLKLETVDLTSFKLTNCNSTEYMFSNTTRELMLSIEKNEEVMIKAGITWKEKEEETNSTKLPLDLLFLTDATGSMGGAIDQVKQDIIHIAVNLMKKKGMENYDLSLAAVFYRDPINVPNELNEIFDFDKNALNFKNFVNNIFADGGGDGPEDWAGAFHLSRNLTWRNDSFKFIVHIADAPGHGNAYVGYTDYYPEEEERTDEIITYFAKNNFSIAGFMVDYDYSKPSFQRAQKIFRNNGNLNYLIKYFSTYDADEDYLLNLVYESFQSMQSTDILKGIDVSEEQGNIDWKKIKENNEIDFALIRAGVVNETDSKFEENYKGAKEQGIPIGVYWISKSIDISEATVECDSYYDILKGKKIEFPIFYVLEDEEIYSYGNWDVVLSVFDGKFSSSEYLLGVRAKSSQIRDTFENDEFEPYQVWMSDTSKDYPELNVDVNIWGYDSKGKIDGIEGDVSLVKSNLNYTKITLLHNYNGY